MLCVPALKAGLNMCNSAQKHAQSHAQPESRPRASYCTRSSGQPIKIDPFKAVLQRALHVFNLAVKDVSTLKNQQGSRNKNCLIPRSCISRHSFQKTTSWGYQRFLVRLEVPQKYVREAEHMTGFIKSPYNRQILRRWTISHATCLRRYECRSSNRTVGRPKYRNICGPL